MNTPAENRPDDTKNNRPAQKFVSAKTPTGRRVTLAFALVVLLVAGVLFWLMDTGRGAPGATALLQYGTPAQELHIPLDTDKTYDISSNGYTIHLRVENGTIAFVDSPCPDHTCESFGRLKDAGDWAACLPAKATLTVEDTAG